MATNIRPDLITIVDDARQIADDLGLRESRGPVVVRTVSRASGLSALTTADGDTDMTLVPTPRVRDVARLRGGLAGQYADGTVLVDRISATYTRAEIDPEGDSYWLVGGEPYRPIEIEQKTTQWVVLLDRMERNT